MHFYNMLFISILQATLINFNTNLLLIRYLTRTQFRFLSATIFFLRFSEDNKYYFSNLLQMSIQPYKFAHTILKLKAQPIAVKARIVTMHDAMERRRQNDDILRIIVQRLREILDVVRLHDALTSVRLANSFARHLTTVIVQPFQAFTNRAVELAHVLHP